MKNSIKEIKNEVKTIGNRAEQIEEIISDIKDRNLEMNRDLSIKKMKEL